MVRSKAAATGLVLALSFALGTAACDGTSDLDRTDGAAVAGSRIDAGSFVETATGPGTAVVRPMPDDMVDVAEPAIDVGDTATDEEPPVPRDGDSAAPVVPVADGGGGEPEPGGPPEIETDPLKMVPDELPVIEVAEEFRPKKNEDGTWLLNFEWLGGFDSGLLAVEADSLWARHAAGTNGGEKTKKGIPLAVRKLDQQVVEVEGYMIPIEFEDGDVRKFFLSRYPLSCCFSMLPTANEVVDVEMVTERGAYYDAYMPIIVKGLFEVHPDGTESEFLQSVFSMKGKSFRFNDDY